MEENKVKVIKIGKRALFEFIYEKFIEKQDIYLDVNAAEVSNYFDIDWENGEFIFCAIRSEDEAGNFLALPREINLKNVMKNMPDTTESMFTKNRYMEYTKEDLMGFSQKEN